VFELSKWYADAVSAEGDVFIGYRARLRSGPFSIAYSAVLDTAPIHSLRHTALKVADREIHWRAPSLGVDGRWQRFSHGIRARIYESAEGAVDWHCLLPCGPAAIDRAGRPTLEGLGYVEHVRVTIPPWRLPIRTLRWGRFLSPRHSLIWIDWQGDFTTRRVYLDGAPVTATALDDDGLTLDDGSHAGFDRGLVLRHGKLGSSVFSSVPGLDRIAPARIFLMEETKWLSRAVLTRPGAEPDQGWCIHEVVQWP
jgi:hypothetical protein